MKLQTILKKCSPKMKIDNSYDFKVKGLSIHSDEVRDNFIFGAIKGNSFDGEKFIPKLLKLKNVAIIFSRGSRLPFQNEKYKNIVFIQVKDVRTMISEIASVYFPNNINEKLAITGTNGKTSISFYVHQIWQKINIKGAFVGTLGIGYKKNRDLKSNLTTPDVVSNHKILKKLTELGYEGVIFEASSIGLHQKRLSPIKFDVVGFTNLTNDHLDYHQTLSNYKISKSLLFTDYVRKDSLAVINTDSKFSKFFLDICKKKKLKVLDYGQKAKFFKIKVIKRINDFFEVKIIFKRKKHNIKIKCCAEFEIYNMICSLIMVFNTKLNSQNLKMISELKNPSGRLEKVFDKKKIRVFVDYAHTPQAISEVLCSLKKITFGKLILVFGCGGDRDKIKRNLMTLEAIKYSDYIIITDDNPRFENPKKIREDMLRGISFKDLKKIKIIGNRKNAIKSAINLLSPHDVLIIAGKGHENYQLIKNKKMFFSDKATVDEYLKSK